MRDELFPPMVQVVPEGRYGVAEVQHFTVDRHGAAMSAFGGARSYVPEGRYARLLVRGDLAMSDTPYERATNQEVVQRAYGRVLIGGYGLGLVLTAILRKPEVLAVTVIEREPDVVALVDSAIRRYVGVRAARKLDVIQADVYQARPLVTGRFDVLWFDVWGDTSTDALAEMAVLTRRYRALKAGPDAYMECWDRAWLRDRRAQERRAGW